MAPLVPSAKATLAYPIYASSFDPNDSSRLFVAGGGGAGRSGVPNRITVLDTSKPEGLTQAGEIELSKDEDNPTSLAVGARRGKIVPIFAGINSSLKDTEAGSNKHFRVFGYEAVGGKGKGKVVNKITEVSRSTVFAGKEKHLYQRVTRLSRPFPGQQKQVGAVTTGLAEKAEIVVFETEGSISSPIGGFSSDKEVVDCDILQVTDQRYLLAYCDAHDVFLQEVSTGQRLSEEPKCVYVTPASDSFEKPTIPSFKGLRWLTKDYLLMLTQVFGGAGVVLQILRFPPSGKGHCRVVKSIRLPSNVQKATGFAVANLTSPLTPAEPQGYTQFVVAVAGHDISISLFKIDLEVEAGVSLIGKPKAFRTYKNAHPMQITSISFSNFTPPAQPITTSTPPQTLRLATTSMSNTVVVHTIPLFPVPLSVKRGQSKSPRYVVALPSKIAANVTLLFSVVGIILISVFFQAILELRGSTAVRLNAHKYLPIPLQEAFGKPYEFPKGYHSSLASPAATSAISSAPGGVPTPKTSTGDVDEIPLIPELIQQLQESGTGKGKEGVVLFSDVEGANRLNAYLHEEDLHGPHEGTKWEDLPVKQKEGWKRKLSDAGHWAEDMGETVLKGVFFGELAGAVGHAVAGA